MMSADMHLNHTSLITSNKYVIVYNVQVQYSYNLHCKAVMSTIFSQ